MPAQGRGARTAPKRTRVVSKKMTPRSRAPIRSGSRPSSIRTSGTGSKGR